MLEHGVETGIIRQLPSGEYVKETRPLTEEERAPLGVPAARSALRRRTRGQPERAAAWLARRVGRVRLRPNQVLAESVPAAPGDGNGSSDGNGQRHADREDQDGPSESLPCRADHDRHSCARLLLSGHVEAIDLGALPADIWSAWLGIIVDDNGRALLSRRMARGVIALVFRCRILAGQLTANERSNRVPMGNSRRSHPHGQRGIRRACTRCSAGHRHTRGTPARRSAPHFVSSMTPRRVTACDCIDREDGAE